MRDAAASDATLLEPGPTAESARDEFDPDDPSLLGDVVELTHPPEPGHSSEVDALGIYLKAIGRYPLLSAEREVQLARSMEDGEAAAKRLEERGKRDTHTRSRDKALCREAERAKAEMINANLRLVIAMARKYRWTGVPLLDLIQEGNIGLMRGVGKFDWRKGFKFSTYATWWIRQAIQRGIADRGRVIRLPVHVHELLIQIGRAKVALESELGREPTDAEIAKSTWLPSERVRELRRIGTHVLSLETPVGQEGEATLGAFVSDEAAGLRYDEVLSRIGRDEAIKVLATLNAREERVIALRFGLTGEEPRTLEEIGKLFGLTRERIRQIEAKALTKLRHPSRSAALRLEI